MGLRTVNNHRSEKHSLAGHRLWEREGSERELWAAVAPGPDGTKSTRSGRIEQVGVYVNRGSPVLGGWKQNSLAENYSKFDGSEPEVSQVL